MEKEDDWERPFKTPRSRLVLHVLHSLTFPSRWWLTTTMCVRERELNMKPYAAVQMEIGLTVDKKICCSGI